MEDWQKGAMMFSVSMPMEDWQKVLAILSQAPWGQANPLIMSIGEQLRSAQAGGQAPRPDGGRGLHDAFVNDAAKRQ